MTHKSSVSFAMPDRERTSKIIFNPRDSKSNFTHNSLHRPSRVLPTLAQSFSSCESQFGINIDFDSRIKYLDSYKNLSKIKEMRSHHQQPMTPISSYLSKLREIKLAPVPMGLIKKQGVCEKLDISNLSMGDHYAEAMAEGLMTLKVRKVIMKNNGLTDLGAYKILCSLDPRYSIEINLAQNHIGTQSITALSRLNTSLVSKLHVINLEGNNLCDKNISLLCNSLSISDKIVELILSRNKISQEGALALANYIKYTTHLLKLDLSWNNIRGDGGKHICSALSDNECIRVMDLSWNSLASPAEENCSLALAETFRNNVKLVHLDISHNQFTGSDCEKLAEGLATNHTLLGLHIEGNYADIDSKGYIHTKSCIDTSTTLNHSRILQKTKALKLKNTSCWVCQQWNEVEFKWRNGKSGTYGEEPVMVHLSFEEFSGCELKEEPDSYYKLIRMCPPGPVFFFFTLKGRFSLSSEYLNTKRNFQYEMRDYTMINCIDNFPSPSQLWLELTPKAKPRLITFKKEVQPPWDFSKSVFRDYIGDYNTLLNECFNEDIERSKIRELCGKEFESIIEYLRNIFPYIKETYKYLASKAWLDWDIWLELIIEFAHQNKIISQVDLRAHDIESIIKTFRYWNSTTEVYFARYQFLELLVRISIMKYYRNRKVAKISQAVKMFFKHFLKVFDHQSSQDFRVERLYKQTIDKILYRHQNVLVKLYYYYAFENVLNLDGFYKIAQVINKDYGVAQTSFVLSKESSVTYSYYNDSLKFVEFLEALVRVIDCSQQSSTLQSRLDVFIDEIIEVKLEPLLNNAGNIIS